MGIDLCKIKRSLNYRGIGPPQRPSPVGTVHASCPGVLDNSCVFKHLSLPVLLEKECQEIPILKPLSLENNLMGIYDEML